MRVLVFGASITQGFWDTEGGWVQRLRTHYDKLQLADFSSEQPTIFNLGILANTTHDVVRRFDAEVTARAREEIAVIFCIGTNNAVVEGNGKVWSTPEQYAQDIETLITKARGYTDKIMFVGLPPCDESKTTPVFWQDIYYTNQRLFEMETAARDVCQERNVSHIPVFETFQAECETGKELFADGLHPNGDGHTLIADLVRPALDDLLES